MATNSKGHVFVYTRSGDTRLFEFDRHGRFVREIGHGLYGFVFAHMVRVDAHDNIWTVDEGSNMVIEFNPAGRVVMVLGRRPEALESIGAMTGNGAYSGANKPYSFSRPTDVAWDAAGDIFVADGYGDSRVVKYDRNGRFIKSAGTRGSGPGQLNLPHTIATDADGNVYIGDRGNARVQVWDNDLNFKTAYTNVGSPVGDLHFARVPISISSSRIRFPTTTIRASSTTPARSTRWNWTARFSAGSARPARP